MFVPGGLQSRFWTQKDSTTWAIHHAGIAVATLHTRRRSGPRVNAACACQSVGEGGGDQRTGSWRVFTLPRIDHEAAAALIILYNKSQSIQR